MCEKINKYGWFIRPQRRNNMHGAYERDWKYCDVCQEKTSHVVEAGIQTCEKCGNTEEK